MGKSILNMQSLLLFTLIWFTTIHARSVVDVSSSRTHSDSVEYNNVAVGRRTTYDKANKISTILAIDSLRGGAYLLPAGWNPLGYKITALGEQFLSLGDSLECDVGRFIASLKANRKRRSTIKDSWLEIVRASKKGQAMRIYRSIDELLDFCIKTGLID